MNWISVVSLGGVLFISWLNGIRIMSVSGLLILCCLFVALFASSSPQSLPTTRSDNPAQKLKFQQLNSLIEKNNNFHRKYKTRNSVTTYVAEYWNLDQSVGEEIAKFIALILRDFIDPWYKYVSTNEEFILCTEEFLANAFSILVTRGRIGLNPVVFFGDKVCFSIQLTLSKLREISTRVRQRPEFLHVTPNMTAEWALYQMSIAEEFRSMGYLHPAFLWDDSTSIDSTRRNLSGSLSMEEFFSPERLKNCEGNYARYIGVKLLKQLMMSPDDYNCRTVRYLATELLSSTVLSSVLSLITPLNINIWIEMAIGLIPTLSESVIPSSEPPNDGESTPTNLSVDSQASIIPTASSDQLHLELSAHYVGAVGLETVSSSCSSSSQEAAAAIVFREGCQLTPVDEQDKSLIRTIDYSNDCGKFIVRKCEFPPLSPNILCISYIRPAKYHHNSPNSTEWYLNKDSLDLDVRSQTNNMKMILEDPRHMNVPLVLNDDVVGHVFVFSRNKQYVILAATHSIDISDPTGHEWGKFEDMISYLFSSPNERESQIEINTTTSDSLELKEEFKKDDIPLEESFLREQLKFIRLMEFQAAMDEFLPSGVAVQSPFKILPSDSTKLKAFRRLFSSLREIVIDGIHPNCQDDFQNTSEKSVDDLEISMSWYLNSISQRYSLISSKSSLSVTSLGNLNLVMWSAFVIARCQTNRKDWLEEVNEASPQDDCNPRCLLCGDRKCYLLAESSVRNYPLQLDEKLFLRDLRLATLTNQMDSQQSCNHYDFVVYLMYISGAYGLLNSLMNTLVLLLTPPESALNEAFSDSIRQRLKPEIHWIYPQCQCWMDGSLLKSPNDSNRFLELLSPLDHISILISTDVLQTPSKSQKSIGIGKTVGLKIEKAFAAATSLFGDSGDEDHDHLPALPPRLATSFSSDRDRNETSDDHIEPSSRVSFLTESGKSLTSKGQMIMASLSSLEDSLTNTASNLSGGITPIYLTFSGLNSDIIEISRLRKQTADDKWEQKNSVSIGISKSSSTRFEDQSSSISDSSLLTDNSSDLVSSKIGYAHNVQYKYRRAEATFHLSILLRDRPESTFLESRRLIVPRVDIEPPVYWIELNKYEKVNTSTTQTWMLYTVTVFKTKSGVCPRHNATYFKQGFELFSVIHTKEEDEKSSDVSTTPVPQPNCICSCWEVQRRYSDFDDLHKHLKTQMGADVIHKLRLPSKNYLKVVQSQQFTEKRMKGLQDYLRSFLQLCPGSTELEIFLEEQNHINATPALAIYSPPQVNELSPVKEDPCSEDHELGDIQNHLHSGSIEDSKDPALHKKFFRIVTSVINIQKVVHTIQDSRSESTTNPTNIEGKIPTDKPVPEDLESLDTSFDSGVFAVIEDRVFSLINELLEVEDMTIMKKRIISLAMRSMRLLFSTSISNWMKHQSKALSPDIQAGYFLKWIRELVWPNEVFYVTPESYVPPDYTTLRQSNLDRIVALLPSALNTYLGENQGQKLLDKVYTLLDNPYILKSLVYMLVDAVLIEIFPEFAEKLSGIDALQH